MHPCFAALRRRQLRPGCPPPRTAPDINRRARRSLVAASAILLLLVAAGAEALETTLWREQEFANFCNRLEPVSSERLNTALGPYAPLATGPGMLAIEKIRLATEAGLTALLERAIAAHWDSLRLFTDAPFAEDSVDPEPAADDRTCALLVERPVLEAIARRYDLHSLWLVKAAPERSDQAPLQMQFLLLGRGRLVIGYDGAATVRVVDYPIRTGLYDYVPFTTMRVINTPEQRGLFTIRTRSGPASDSGPFTGPINARIESMAVDGENRILVRYRLLFSGVETIDRLPIERR